MSPQQGSGPRYRGWVRGASAAVVAGVAAYSSYGHQRVFALEAGADAVTAAIWPLSVDGLAILSSIGLLDRHPGRVERVRRLRWALRLSFLLSVVVSLAANVAAAPVLSWQAVLVAGWPPLALLLAVDLVMHGHGRSATTPASLEHVVPLTPIDEPASAVTAEATSPPPVPDAIADAEPSAITAAVASEPGVDAGSERSAEEVMWAHCEQVMAQGRVPSGAELDRVAGTHTYGRAVLARWRREGRVPPRATDEPAADELVGEVTGGRNGVRPVMAGRGSDG